MTRYFQNGRDFSLVLGGPLFQLLRRTHLAGDAMELLRQRILLISLVAWLPLLVLSLAEGQALGGRVAVPFLLDVEVHIRFLIALPLLIVAELVVHQRMRFVVRQFLERNLIPQSALPRFEKAIASAFRLRNSVPIRCLPRCCWSLSYMWSVSCLSGVITWRFLRPRGTRCRPSRG